MREERGCVVVDVARPHDHPDLPAGLERIDLLHARLRRRELLERLEPLDVMLEALAPCAGT